MIRLLHPAVLVTAGCILILLVQTLAGSILLFSSAMLTCIAAGFATTRWWRVVKRLRYIFLALWILFAWQTPGTLLMPQWDGWSPTLDGLWLALEHGVRLLGVAALVALLMQFLRPEEWVAGLCALVSPLRCIGLSPERFAVRMHLVLQYVGSSERHKWGNWLDDDMHANIGEAVQVWRLKSLKPLDGCLIVAMLIACLGWLLCRA